MLQRRSTSILPGLVVSALFVGPLLIGRLLPGILLVLGPFLLILYLALACFLLPVFFRPQT